MLQPKDFNETQAYGNFQPLRAGGHICKIVSVEETKSKQGGKAMIVIAIDTDKTDGQPSYFQEQYKNNTKAGKKWSNNAVTRQLVFDADGNTNKGFKTFIETVEKSNNGFKVAWGDGFAACFKNKLVGGVFGREEYLNDYSESKFATKLQSFRTIEDIKNGVEVPKDKLLNPSNSSNSGNYNTDNDITPVDDGDDMPF